MRHSKDKDSTENNSFLSLKNSELSQASDDEQEVNESKITKLMIEEIFKVSSRADARGYYHLRMLPVDQNGDYVLNWDNLDNILMERLGMYQTEREGSVISNRLNYLLGCYGRCRAEHHSKILPVDHKTLSSHIEKGVNFVVQIAITYMLEPDIFNSKSSAFELYELLNVSQTNSLASSFVMCIRNRINLDETKNIFAPVLLIVQGKLKLYTYSVTDPDIIDTINILNYFTSDEILVKIFLQSSVFLPAGELMSASHSDFSSETFLGLIFGIPSAITGGVGQMYLNASYDDNVQFMYYTNCIQSSLVLVYDRVVMSLKLLLAHPKFRGPIMLWLHRCLDSHIYRSKLASTLFISNMENQTSDGFFTNLSYAFLKIMSPISSDLVKFISKVEYDFCDYPQSYTNLDGASYEFSYLDEMMLVPKPKDTPLKSERKEFNFPTLWYFITHKALKIGLIPCFETYIKLVQTVNEIRDEIEDDPESRQTMTHRFDEVLQGQLFIRAQLLNQPLIDMLVDFISATCVFHLYTIGVNIVYTTEPYSSDIPTQCSKLQSMPEYIIDQVASITTFLSQLLPESLTRYDHQTRSILLCLSIFMGSKNYASNPHLRAKLAQAINALIGDRSIEYSPSALSVKMMFQSDNMLIAILPRSLLQLFVDIEFTGHAQEFEQKFAYRFHMYKILFYIWDIPGYIDCIESISLEMENTESEELPFFLKFINLLVNDATFLLDEALGMLHKIHDLEHEIHSVVSREDVDEQYKEKFKELEGLRKRVEGYNVLSRDTVKAISLLTSSVKKPFLAPAMVDRIAALLNYFLRHLVGAKKRELKVNAMEDLQFEPKTLVTMICEIMSNLQSDDKFCRAVVADERSFSSDLPELALSVLVYINANPILISKLTAFKNTLLSLLNEKGEEISYEEIPEEYLDPISYTLMSDPVMLPSSRIIIDRTTITKHLLSDESDPFNRSKLTLGMIIPQSELKDKINEWLSKRSGQDTNNK